MPTRIHPQTLTKPTGETFTFNMVEVEGGTFMMGLNGEYWNGESPYETQLDSFLISEFPVTQDLYEFMTGKNPSHFIGKRRPVEQVSWYEAVEFCNGLSQLTNLDPCCDIDRNTEDPENDDINDDKKWLVRFDLSASGYRLLTEAEWEYAARGGKYWEDGFEYAGGDNLQEIGWYDENSLYKVQSVGFRFLQKHRALKYFCLIFSSPRSAFFPFYSIFVYQNVYQIF